MNLTESLLKAISIIADKSAEEISSDTTIKAIVKQVVSTSEGKYLVTYNNGDFYAYVQSGSTDVYVVEDELYILVPEGDMSQKKFIIGKVADNQKNFTFRTLSSSLLNDYNIIGNNIVIEKEYFVGDANNTNRLDVVKMQPLKLNSHAAQKYHYCYLHDPGILEDSIEYDTIKNRIISIDEESFSNSAKQADALLIRAHFKADIDTENIGNYGIIVNVAFSDETNPQVDNEGNITYPPKLVAYILDANKMTGNPMKFYDYVSQYSIAPFNGQQYLYIDSIVAFSEGFVDRDITPNTHQYLEDEIDIADEINIIGESGDIEEDIFYDDPYIYIDNIEIAALSENVSINGDYKLRLTTPRGNTIKAGSKNELKINAIMSYLNQDITQNTIFYWGVKNLLVTSTHDDYNAKLGPGYRWLNTENGNELTLTSADLTAAENEYICVAVYESDIIIKTSILLYNNNNKINITIDSSQGTNFQFNEGNPTLTCLINGKTEKYQEDLNYSDDAFSFIWSKEDPDYGVILLDTNEDILIAERETEIAQCSNNSNGLSDAGRSKTEVLSYYSTRIAQVQDIYYPEGIYKPKIVCKLKNTNTYVTYLCSVYRAGIFIGYGSITLQNHKEVINNNYYVTITNGNQVFQYDEFGIAPNSQKQQNPIEVLDLVAVFHSPQGAEVTPKKIRWIMPQGETLIEIPSLGLKTDVETGEKYFLGSVFPLSIKDTYNNCNNNQVTVIVTHADGTEYRQSSNLLFTKIGEIGTNGTDAVVRINERVSTPENEKLTLIKSNGTVFYNSYDIDNNYVSEDKDVLEASLYINNSKVLGHSSQWSIAGNISNRYTVESNIEDSNICHITYDEENENELDTRIIKVETNLQGKSFHSFYGLPAIEYNDIKEDEEYKYTYEKYPIKIIQNDTLTNILYDSNGTNPTYNENQGAHVELVGWNNNGYLTWAVESGAKSNFSTYDNPNFLISNTPKSKTGSNQLNLISDIDEIQSQILEIQSISQECSKNAESYIKEYINEFIADIERIGVDDLISISTKINNLNKRIKIFENEMPEKKNIYIQTVYEKYLNLFESIESEYEECQNSNKEYSELYNKVQNIWKSEWPSVITPNHLFINLNIEINTIQELIQRYQQAYQDRSNEGDDIIQMPVRLDIFEEDFCNKLELLDEKYNNYDADKINIEPFLIEYAKVLIAYLSILVDETQEFLKDKDIEDRYSFIHTNFDENCGKNIYDIVFNADNSAEGVYNNVRSLYQYYQSLYLNIKKYQISEESNTLNTWIAILKDNKPNLLERIYVIPNEFFNGLYMNNNIVGSAFIREEGQDTLVAKIYIPIIMTLNTYELAALNGWDGTNIDIGEDHIMTPQIGAGIKDSATNTFTGMVMGAINNTNSETTSFKNKVDKINKVGLIGYSDGKQSLFIDAKTGKACFGLPESDDNFNEGRIELVPGGISKIGNWKIGNRFLYNIVDGSYERRKDGNQNKIMIPHDKHGIILSSDNPYIHVKGKVYENTNISNIDYADEYNNLNVGDSLELRLDPDNDSLFSIVQHTVGFGDEENDLLTGYKFKGTNDNTVHPDNLNTTSTINPSTNTIVKDYIINENVNKNDSSFPQKGYGAEYYLYKLVVENDEYQPYYRNESELISNDIQDTTTITVTNLSHALWRDLSWENFKESFIIDSETGVVTYNPTELKWTRYADRWKSITGLSNFNIDDNFNIDLNYLINSSNIEDEKICSITNTTNFDIYRVLLTGSLLLELNNIDFINSNNYIQFYLVENDEDEISEAKLISDQINFENNYDEINIELYSYKEQYLISEMAYILKAKIDVNYNINGNVNFNTNGNNNSRLITRSISTTKKPPVSDYGTSTITNNGTIEEGQLSTSFGINGQYNYNNETHIFKFKLNNNDVVYDFIIWTSGENPFIACGQTFLTNRYATFINNNGNVFNEINLNNILNEINSNNSLNITFYSKGTFVTENFLYNEETISSNNKDFYVCNDCSTTSDSVDKNISVDNFSLIDGVKIQVKFTNGNTVSEPSFVLNDNDNDKKPVKSYTGESLNDQECMWEVGSTYYFIYDSSINNNTGAWKLQDIVDSSNNISIIGINETINYSYSTPVFEDVLRYSLIFPTETKYKQITIPYKLKSNIKIENIYGYTPPTNEDKDILCITNDANSYNLQGMRYAVTYWTDTNQQRIRFYKPYYEYVIKNNKKQYGYIDVEKNGDIYYKYIKTLKNDSIKKWFLLSSIPADFWHSESSSLINETTTICDWIDVSADNCQDIVSWKEFIRVGLDENGRLYTAGLQDKKTYSRTGKIFAFGKVPNLYGQEIRASISSNNFIPLIKTFSQISDTSSTKTTYFTQGKNDDGNISIRTSKNGYIELGVSQNSENEINTIPEIENFIKISYNNGIQIQNNTSKGLSIDVSTIEILSKNTFCQFLDDYVWTKTPYFITSSLSSTTARNAYNNNSISDNNYWIKASSGENANISLQVNSINTGLIIKPSQIKIGTNTQQYFEMNNSSNLINSKIVMNNMSLEFTNETCILKNGRNSYIQITPDDNDNRIIDIKSNLNGRIKVRDKVEINSLLVTNSSSFNNNIYINTNAYYTGTLHIGYNNNSNKTASMQTIRLYKGDTNKTYIKLTATLMEKLYDWYSKRWMIAYNDGILWFKNVANNNNPEGNYSNSTYNWTGEGLSTLSYKGNL